jgi:L-lactate transport
LLTRPALRLQYTRKLATGWQQHYTLFGQGLALSAAVASVPTLLLLYLLGVKRQPAWAAALAGLAATALLAEAAYRMPVVNMLSAAALGAAFGLFPISWIIVGALVLYQITVKTGRFVVIQSSIASITSDVRLQGLLVAFAFGAFLEGCAGFGTPVAVAAAMLVGLGFAPFYASAICLLANTAPVAFGSIGIPVVTLAGITGLPLNQISAVVGRLCAPVSFLLPAYLILATDGRRALRSVWPAALVCGGAFAAVQFAISNFVGAQLTDILSSLSAICALVALLRVWHPAAKPRPDRSTYTSREIAGAWMPYLLLVLFVLAWGYAPLAALLNRVSIPVQWPALHNAIERMPPVVKQPSAYAAVFNFNWLAASGTSCLLATVAAAIFARMKPREYGEVVLLVMRQLVKPTLTVTAVLAMAFVMNYSGATGTLGLAFAATGSLFPLFSPLMGWLGVFLTGSDTASNALFGNLQVVTATRLGFDPVLVASANSVGGVMGKMISLQTIAVAAAATGMSVAEQAKLFRFTLRHSIALATVVGVEVLLYAYVIK